MEWEGLMVQIRNKRSHFTKGFKGTGGTGREMLPVETLWEIREACLLVPQERRDVESLSRSEIKGYGAAADKRKMDSLMLLINEFDCKERPKSGKRGKDKATVGEILRYVTRLLNVWETYQSHQKRLGEEHGITSKHVFESATVAVLRKTEATEHQVSACSGKGQELHGHH